MDNVIENISAIYEKRLRTGWISLAGAGFFLLLTIIIASGTGSAAIPFPDIFNILIARLFSGGAISSYPISQTTILLDIRLPRILMAGLTGAALAVSGAAYQGMFRNPLADPYLIGISQGAALGAVIGFLLPMSVPAILIPVLAFAGALLSVLAVFFIARTGKTLPLTTLILGGVALGAFLASITSYLLIISGDRLHGIIFWLLGTLSVADWWRVSVMAPYILVGAAVLLLLARPLNIMQLDEEQARQLGINVEGTKLIVLAAATLCTAAAVCFCGMIGFVGIIIPHAVRLVFGPDYRLLLPMSLLTGAAFLILADTAARTLLSPTEVPIGVITAFIGAPFFLYLLRQKKKAVF
jgi:iron complex transport system permease protein